MLGVFAEFETNLRRERQLEGIAKAKAAGVYKGRPASIDAAQVRAMKGRGSRASEIAKALKIGRASVYQAPMGSPSCRSMQAGVLSSCRGRSRMQNFATRNFHGVPPLGIGPHRLAREEAGTPHHLPSTVTPIRCRHRSQI
jgi:Helix-turn-helix domain of resolvase